MAKSIPLAALTPLLLQNPLEKQPMIVFGDSYGYTNQGADYGTLFCDRFAARNNMQTPQNYAVAGTRSDQVAVQTIAKWVPNTRGFVLLADGGILNDIFQITDTSGLSTTAEAFRMTLSYLTAQAVLPIYGSSWRFDSSWAAGVSSTVGGYVDVAFVGDAVDIMVGLGATGGAIAVFAAGTQIGTINTGGYLYSFTGCQRFSGFGPGAHTLRLVVASGTVTLAGALIPSPTPPTIMWTVSGQLARSATENARIVAYQAAAAAIVALFPTVIPVPMDAGWNPITMLGPDTIHPNDLGQSYICDRLMIVAARAITWRQGLNRLTTSYAPGGGAGLAAAAYTPTSPAYRSATATVPAQVNAPTVTTGGQLNISWTQPSDNGSTIVGYAIQTSPAGAGAWTTLGTVSGATTSYIITSGLTASASYDVRIAAINAVGTGPYSAAGTGMAGANVIVYAADTFARSTLGSTTTGGFAWTQNNGQTGWTCNGSALILTTAAVNAADCYIDDGQSDGTISFTNVAAVNAAGVVFRASGTNNVNGYIVWNNHGVYTLSKRSGLNSYTSIATASGVTPGAGDVLAIVLAGSSITIKCNGATIITATDSSYTGTRHGGWLNTTAVDTYGFTAFSHTSATT